MNTSLRAAVSLIRWGSSLNRFGRIEYQPEHSNSNHTQQEMETGDRLFRYFPGLEVKDRDILDLGSGYGGKAICYIEAGARSVTGVEPFQQMVQTATDSASTMCKGLRPRFITGRGEDLPFRQDSFDLILSDNVFEHVQDLRAVLNECYRVLKPGGRLYAIFPPYYGPQAHHLDFLTTLPGLHYLFSARTLVDATNEVLKERPDIDQSPLKYNGGLLPNLNGTSVRGFLDLVSKSQFSTIECAPLPLGCGITSGARDPLRLTAQAVCKLMLNLPILNDPFTSVIRCVLSKGES